MIQEIDAFTKQNSLKVGYELINIEVSLWEFVLWVNNIEILTGF